MSIVIEGMEMPMERENFNLTIKYNGTVLDTETGMYVAEAHELPPHGRLIDADALIAAHEQVCSRSMKFNLDLAPTIIPAEEE